MNDCFTLKEHKFKFFAFVWRQTILCLAISSQSCHFPAIFTRHKRVSHTVKRHFWQGRCWCLPKWYKLLFDFKEQQPTGGMLVFCSWLYIYKHGHWKSAIALRYTRMSSDWTEIETKEIFLAEKSCAFLKHACSEGDKCFCFRACFGKVPRPAPPITLTTRVIWRHKCCV